MEQENKPEEVKKPQQVEASALQGSSDEETLINIAKRFSGYKFFSMSRIENYPDDPKKYSEMLKSIKFQYLIRGRDEDFEKVFGKKDLVFIQAHTEMPTMAEDGLYDWKDIEGNHIKTHVMDSPFILPDEESIKNFRPMILIKEGKDKYSKIYGNPYCTITPEKAAAVLAMQVAREEDAKEEPQV